MAAKTKPCPVCKEPMVIASFGRHAKGCAFMSRAIRPCDCDREPYIYACPLAPAHARIAELQERNKALESMIRGAIVTTHALSDQVHDMQARVLLADNPSVNACVDRFLGWELPKDFGPDCGISFTPPRVGWPIGTNLFTATQAKAMLTHVLGPLLEDMKEAEAERDTYKAEARQLLDKLADKCSDLADAKSVSDTYKAEAEALRKEKADRETPCIWLRHWVNDSDLASYFVAGCGATHNRLRPFCDCGHPVEVRDAP